MFCQVLDRDDSWHFHEEGEERKGCIAKAGTLGNTLSVFCDMLLNCLPHCEVMDPI